MVKSNSQKLKPLLVDKLLWELLSEYLTDEKERLVTQLISCNTEDLKLLQGEYKALSKLLNLKTNLNTEEQAR